MLVSQRSVEEELAARVQAAFPEAQLSLTDLTGSRDHWHLKIVCASFEGKNSLARQRSIYAAVGDLMQGPVHALTMQVLTPAEAEAAG